MPNSKRNITLGEVMRAEAREWVGKYVRVGT
jgi:hypothetical protein